MKNTVSKVIYELYESDYLYLKDKLDDDTHEINREICLVLDNGEHIYISWADTPIQFSIGYNKSRRFQNKPDKTLEASSLKLWKPIIGEVFDLIFHDKNKQLLELRCKNKSIYFAPQETNENTGESWNTDILHISSNKPPILN